MIYGSNEDAWKTCPSFEACRKSIDFAYRVDGCCGACSVNCENENCLMKKNPMEILDYDIDVTTGHARRRYLRRDRDFKEDMRSIREKMKGGMHLPEALEMINERMAKKEKYTIEEVKNQFIGEFAHRPFIIAVDFDGTIAEFNPDNWGRPYKTLRNAKEAINKLHELGVHILLFTCRESKNQGIAEDFMVEHGIHYDSINRNLPWLVEKYGHDSRKVNADIYIDDKGITPLPSWKEIFKIVIEQKYASDYDEAAYKKGLEFYKSMED